MGDRLKELAAAAAIRTGIGLAGGVGEKLIGNLFKQGGAADLAMTPQATLDQRQAKLQAQLAKQAAERQATQALALERRASTALKPVEADLKRAQAAKARTETAIKPMREARKQKQLSFSMQNAKDQRQHNESLRILQNQLDIQRDALQSGNRMNEKKFEDKLKKGRKRLAASLKGTYVLRNGTPMSATEFGKHLNTQFKLINLAVDQGNSERAMQLLDAMDADLEQNGLMEAGIRAADIDTTVADLKKTKLQTGIVADLGEAEVFTPNMSQADRETLSETRRRTLEGIGQSSEQPRRYSQAQQRIILRSALEGKGGLPLPKRQELVNRVSRQYGFKPPRLKR
jgi:hypothetical protein